MDFVSDSFANGGKFRAFTLVDQYTRECPAIEVDTTLPSLRVIRVLERLARERGLPEEITCDNGPEFVSRRLQAWCAQKGVLLRYIGKRSDLAASTGSSIPIMLKTYGSVSLASR